MRTLAAAAFLLRRVRADAGALALIWVVVAVTASLFAAAPRVFGLVADAALREELVDATPARRGVDLSGTSAVGGDGELEATLARMGEGYFGRLPLSVQALIGDRVAVASSARFAVANAPKIPTSLVFQWQSGLDDLITLVDGRMPVATGEHLAVAD